MHSSCAHLCARATGHTGVIIYGVEYFYGGGISFSPPGQSVAGQPTQIIPLGKTRASQAAFHAFLRSVSHRYTPDNYSLLRHNCNNFSDAAARFLTGDGIPAFITGLPEQALNTPLGAMFRPMLEQMERRMKEQGGMQGMQVPGWEGGAGGGQLRLPPPAAGGPTVHGRRVQTIAAAAAATAAAESLTAAAAATPAAAAAAATSSSSSSHPHAQLALSVLHAPSTLSRAPADVAAAATAASSSAFVFAPMLSRDAKHKSFETLIKVASRKRANSSSDEGSDSKVEGVAAGALSAAETAQLRAAVVALSTASQSTSSSPSSSSSLSGSDGGSDVLPRAMAVLLRLLTHWPQKALFGVCGLLRLLVLDDLCLTAVVAAPAALSRLASFVPGNDAADDAHESTTTSSPSASSTSTSSSTAAPVSVQLMSLCTLANCVRGGGDAATATAVAVAVAPATLDCAKRAVVAADAAVALTGATLLFNISLCLSTFTDPDTDDIDAAATSVTAASAAAAEDTLLDVASFCAERLRVAAAAPPPPQTPSSSSSSSSASSVSLSVVYRLLLALSRCVYKHDDVACVAAMLEVNATTAVARACDYHAVAPASTADVTVAARARSLAADVDTVLASAAATALD
jgi:hypothetical protein